MVWLRPWSFAAVHGDVGLDDQVIGVAGLLGDMGCRWIMPMLDIFAPDQVRLAALT